MSAPSSAVSITGAGAGPRVFNPWLVALAVVVPTFMEVLDTTIANVALRYIAGGLSSAVTDSEWVITSYLAANAVILPISGWLAAQLGRRTYFLISIAMFTISSVLCGMANSLGALILFRVLQGLAGGGLQPCSQGILLDSFPPEKQGAAQTLFGIAALLAPVLGPTLGGWITDQYSWRWIFLINLPVGTVAFALCWAMVRDPDYLRDQRKELRRGPFNFDSIGLGLLVITIVCWEVLLSKGQEWDWFDDAFGRVQVLGVLFVVGLGGLIFWEGRHSLPIVNFRPLRDRNFAISCLIIFCSFGILYGSSTLLPALLESLFGYDAFHAGLVLSPSGFFTILAIVIVGVLLTRGVDARWLIAVGLVIVAVGNFWMSQMNLEIGPWQVVWARIVMVGGLGFVFAPVNVAAYFYIPRSLRGAAVGMLSLLRNEGGSVGTSMGQTITERREQFHLLRLGEQLDNLNPAVNSYLSNAQPLYLQQTGDPAAAQQMALRSLENLRQQQASALSYFDAFLIFAVIGFVLAILVFVMRRSVAAKGAHLAAE
ncbi:MAG TPA: DHA2 family efflux MFS transporter permease subunit [Chthoniobacterales bacterium]|nr:DHA2 family efflux MFS transporter permease subunit [Chthoniobacterales bacterium]